MNMLTQSNISLSFVLPDGTKRGVQPYEVPEVDAMLTQAVANLKVRNLKLTEGITEAIRLLELDEPNNAERVLRTL